jgi:creatinine amidohydrolase
MTAEGPIAFAAANREQLVASATDLVLVPVGACEQHGPHLPTGTDFMIVSEVAERAARALSTDMRVRVTPTLPVGYSRHHLPFGATLSVSAETLQRFLIEVCDSLVNDGFRQIFLINGHGGNSDIVNVVARETALAHGVTAGAGSYWVMAWDALVAEGAHERNRLPGHAGAFETSIVMALWPELVSSSRPHRDGDFGVDPAASCGDYLSEDHRNWARIAGYSDSPDRANAADGHRWLDATVSGVVAGLRRFHAAASDTHVPTPSGAETRS